MRTASTAADMIMADAFTSLIALAVTAATACALTGRSRATHYRRLNPPMLKTDPVPQSERAKPPRR